MTKKLFLLIVFVCLSSSLFASDPLPWQAEREWKTTDGKFSVIARFVGVIDDAVVLKRKDNDKLAEVLKARLSKDDLDFIAREYEALFRKGEKEEVKADTGRLAVFIDCKIEKDADGKVRGVIETNLPDKTKIMIGVTSGQFGAQDSKEIIGGKAITGWFSNKGKSLLDGEYEMNITVPLAWTQPKEVQDILGKDYANVTGAILADGPNSVGKIMKVVVPFSIGQKKGEAVSFSKDKAGKIIAECESLIAELRGFKDKPDFLLYGFSAASPYNAWMTKVANLRKRTPPLSEVGMPVAALPAQVSQLGLEYVFEKGKETEWTKWFLSECLQEAKDSIK